MSDIAIRFDGLLFGGLIALSAAILAIAALLFAAFARWRAGGKRRSALIARTCTIGLVACLASLAALVAYMDLVPRPTQGPDWLDLAALPWAAMLLGGLVWLARAPAR